MQRFSSTLSAPLVIFQVEKFHILPEFFYESVLKVFDVGEVNLRTYNHSIAGKITNNGHTLKVFFCFILSQELVILHNFTQFTKYSLKFALEEGSRVQPFISGGRLKEERYIKSLAVPFICHAWF